MAVKSGLIRLLSAAFRYCNTAVVAPLHAVVRSNPGTKDRRMTHASIPHRLDSSGGHPPSYDPSSVSVSDGRGSQLRPAWPPDRHDEHPISSVQSPSVVDNEARCAL
jgi:hypothetical protein